MSARLRLLVALAGVVVLGVHLRYQPPTLEDIDSINFALGVESFDVANHRPHPPGYPVYIALAKASTSALHAIAPSWDRDRRAAVGLAVWSALAAGLAVPIFTLFWMRLGAGERTAFFAALLAITTPIFWFNGSRPLSDMPGLVAAVGVLVLLIDALPPTGASPNIRRALLATGAAGIVVGIRSQTMWITGPIVVVLIAALLRRGHVRAAAAAVAAGAAGVLLWLVPLVIYAGGPGAFVRAVRSQGAEDFTGVEMVATTSSWRVFSTAMDATFVQPWYADNLAIAMLLAAVCGLVAWSMRARGSLGLVLAAFVPYVIFHLAFHETAMLRYALPVVVPVSGLAAVGLSLTGRVAAPALAAAIAGTGLYFSQPALVTYATEGAPIHRAFQQMVAARASSPEAPVLRMHHQVWHGVRRPLDWFRPQWDAGPQPFPGDREWRSIVEHWRSGASAPVWFLKHLPRTDLALFDPRSVSVRGRYLPAPDVHRLMGDDTRLDAVEWIELRRPFWMLGPGWSLNAEITGMTDADKVWPNTTPAIGYVQAGTPLLMKLGGRHHGPAGAGAARVRATLAGRPVGEWRVAPESPWMIEWIDVPAFYPASFYDELRVEVLGDGPGPLPSFGLEQFDAAPPGEPIVAYLSDWNEFEGDGRTGRTWRWTTDRSTIEIRNHNSDLTLTLRGESPLRYFDRAPNVVVRAGNRELARFAPGADFTQSIAIAAADLTAASGRVTIETDLVRVPAERENSPDKRKLGLRLFEVSVARR